MRRRLPARRMNLWLACRTGSHLLCQHFDFIKPAGWKNAGIYAILPIAASRAYFCQLCLAFTLSACAETGKIGKNTGAEHHIDRWQLAKVK